MIFSQKNNKSRGAEGMFVKPCEKTFGATHRWAVCLGCVASKFHKQHQVQRTNKPKKIKRRKLAIAIPRIIHRNSISKTVPPPHQDNTSVCTGGWGKVEVVRLRRLSWQPRPQRQCFHAEEQRIGGTWCGLHWVIGSWWRRNAHGSMAKGLLRTSGRKPDQEKGVAQLIWWGGDGGKRSGVFNYSQITHRLDRSCFKENPWKWCGHQQPSASLVIYLSILAHGI